MRDWVENNPAIVIVCMVVFGLFSYIGVGFQISVMMTLAEVSSIAVIKLVVLSVLGCLFTVLPVTFLYDIISTKNMENIRLRRRTTVAGAGQQNTDHWNVDIGDDDDIDGDGNGDDSLRRLGVIR